MAQGKEAAALVAVLLVFVPVYLACLSGIIFIGLTFIVDRPRTWDLMFTDRGGFWDAWFYGLAILSACVPLYAVKAAARLLGMQVDWPREEPSVRRRMQKLRESRRPSRVSRHP